MTPHPPTSADLTIEKLVYGGDALARLDGRVVLLPGVIPGELVRARLAPAARGILRPTSLEVLSPSPLRQSPPCPFFSRCGGCHYQHLAYSAQLDAKRSILLETLRRIGKLDPALPVSLLSAEPLHYRNRIQLHIDNRSIGYFAAASRRLCPVSSCPIASPSLNAALATLAAELPRLPRFAASLELFSNDADLQISLSDPAPPAFRALLDTLGVTSPILYNGLRVSRGSFFQVNRFLIAPLLDAALSSASGASALDLYAGVGLFASALAARFPSVTAVESGPRAARDLAHNALSAPRPFAALRASAEDYLASLTASPDFVLADPPRAGLGPAVSAHLLRLRPPRLALVSCDPATLARDLAALTSGGYRISSLTLADLFPQTFHIETVVQLEA